MGGWSASFVEQLGRENVQAFYLLESVPVPDGAVNWFGGELRLSSFNLAGYKNVIQLAGSGISYGELRARFWQTSQMAWSVGLSAVEALGDLRATARRGQVVQLRVGFSRDPATFETVAVGTVYNIERKSGTWSIIVRDLVGSLISRITEDKDETSLFHDLASTDIAVSAYTPGDTTLNVTSTTGFRDDGSGNGAVQITDDTGSTFILTYTGTTATTFTGVSASDQFDTTRGASAIGNAVEEVALVTGQPIEVIRKMLVSTGAGTNGAYDTLPASWGFALPQALVDDDDMTSFVQDTVPASGSDNQHFVAVTEATNPKAVLDAWLNGAGYFLTTYQGKITCRAALDPKQQTTRGHIELTDRQIAALDEYQAYDRASPVEYVTSRAIGQDGGALLTTDTFIETLPMALSIEHDLAGLYSHNGNYTAIRLEIGERLSVWDIKTPERYAFRIAGWSGAIPAPGSTIDLTTSLITDRQGRALNQRRGLVIQAGANWFGSESRIVVLLLPTIIVAQPAP